MELKVSKTEQNLLTAFAGEAPERCPACDFPRSYYELMAENY